MIPFSNPHAGYMYRKAEIDFAIKRVLDSGWYILGKEVSSFEEEFASYCGVSNCIGVGNGTDAIELALRALELGNGDEVITVSHTAVATAASIELAGCTPVLVDIDPVSFTMVPDQLEAAVTPRTRAIIPVHLYGHPADMDAILKVANKYDLFVVEDCAQAHGATYKGQRVGGIGHMGCFSFYPTKNLGALGDGGAVVIKEKALAEKARCLREYGWDASRNSRLAGMNSRLDAIQAAVLRVKLAYLDEDNASRRRIASLYAENLQDLDNVVLPKSAIDVKHVYHLYVIRVKERDRILAELANLGIGAGIHYSLPVHLQKAYRCFGCSLPQTEAVCSEILSLPMYPELADDAVFRTVKELRKLLKNN